MSKSDLQKLAFLQQASHLAFAHGQALKLLIEGQQVAKLSVKNVLSYLELAKLKLSETEYNEFGLILKQCKAADCDIIDVLSRICTLLQGYPELIQGFGMFLPPSINVQLQTGGILLHGALKDGNNASESSEAEKESEDLNLKEDLDSATPQQSNHDGFSELEELIINKELKLSKIVGVVTSSISYLRKVKERFLEEPAVLQKFLHLLESVKKGKNTGNRTTLETEVYHVISDLFQGHNDLIEEFKIFVPDAMYENQSQDQNETSDNILETNVHESSASDEDAGSSELPKYTAVNDPSIASVYKFGSYEEHLFFDQVRSALVHREVFDNFLRCLMLYNDDVVTRSELLKLATSFLGKFPDLLKKLKDMLGFNESGDNIETIPMKIVILESKRNDPEVALDIDYATGGRTGASYRALPKDFEQPKCSGRTALCKEVLNDTWVSFPSWSEDSTFVTSCKTQYEEIIYRCEDERFELDMAIAANAYTMQLIDSLQKKINKMTPEEKSMFSLDDHLGGTSTVLHQKALHRLYGDKTEELVEGLKRNPVVAVPIILKRLKVKEDEWKEKEAQFNNIWRDQIDKYYLKSLDHQGINFKQNDSKSFRPKSLLNELDMVYAENKENPTFTSSAHFILEFKDMSIFQDAVNLMLQYLKKLPGVYRDDRRRIELLIRSFIPYVFGAPSSTIPVIVLDDEEGESKENEDPMDTRSENEERSGPPSPSGSGRDEGSSEPDESISNEENELSDEAEGTFVEDSDVFDKMDPLPTTNMPYTLFFVSKIWYVFFRQFHILCERLTRLLFESNRQEVTIKKEHDSEDEDTEPVKHIIKPSYEEMINNLSLLLSGTIDYPHFEEKARSLFGIHAFVSFTMDKLVLNIVRQLQQVVTDDICKQTTAYFVQHIKTLATDGYASHVEASRIESDYIRKVEKIMEDEKCFRIVWHKKDQTLTIQLIEHEVEESIPDPCEVEKWSNYLDSYIHDDFVSDELLSDSCLPVFLPRNLRKQFNYWKAKVIQVEKLWKARHSSKFLKKNAALFSKKRKAIAIANALARKMMRSSPTEVPASCSSAASANEAPETDQQEEEVTTPEPPTEPVKDAEVDVEIECTIANEVDMADKSDIVLVDLSTEHTSLQEESVHDSDPTDYGKSFEILSESIEIDPEVQNSVLVDVIGMDDTCVIEKNDSESMDIDYNSCGSSISIEKKDSSKDTTYSTEENASESKDSDNKVCVDKPFKDIETEVDLSSRIDMAVEAASRVIETIDVDSPESKPVSDSELVEKTQGADVEEDSKNEDNIAEEEEIESPRRKSIHRSGDYTIRTRRNRINQSYVKRRLKRNLYKNVHLPKGKRRSQARLRPEEFEDVFFDYEYFSQLTEDDKISYLSMRNLVVQDDTEGAFKKGSYKIHFVQNCDTHVYRKGSLSRAKEIHQAISEIKTSNFNAWHRVWLDRYVTPSMLKFCNDWMLRSDPQKYKLVLLTVSNCAKPPYIPYNKYKVRYYKIEA